MLRLLPSALTARGRLLSALLACLLCAPALRLGLVLDDYVLADRLRAPDGGLRAMGLLDAFSLARPGEAAASVETGLLPWWTDPGFSLWFLRPLSALTHALDFTVFADAPWWMHVESLLVLLALNLAVGTLYARLFADSARAATLAFLLYVVAPGHAVAASWLANRNACLAALLAVLSLLAHARASRTGERSMRLCSLALMLGALGAGEMGVSTLALLVAHSASLAPGSARARLVALSPALALTAAWMVLYRALGCGTEAGSLYVDFAHDPLGNLVLVAQRLPLLLFGQWGLPVISFAVLCSRSVLWGAALLSALFVALLAPPLVRLGRRDARARFALVSALLALLPVAATVPHDRLLLVSDVGACALLGLAADEALAHGAPALRRFVRLFQVRLVAGVALSPAYAASLHQQVAVSKQPFVESLREPSLRAETLVFVNAPCTYFAALLAPMRRYEGGPVPARVHTLAPGIYPLEVARIDATTLALRSPHGLLQRAGTYQGKDGEPGGPVAPLYIAQALSQFSLDARRFSVGERRAVGDLQIEVRALTREGLPREVWFRFAQPLEDARYRFVVTRGRDYLPFTPPPLGQHVQLAPVLE